MLLCLSGTAIYACPVSGATQHWSSEKSDMDVCAHTHFFPVDSPTLTPPTCWKSAFNIPNTMSTCYLSRALSGSDLYTLFAAPGVRKHSQWPGV